MASYQRGYISIITSVEELPSGRYGGFVTLTEGKDACSLHTCKQCRDNSLDAHPDADAEVARPAAFWATIAARRA